MPRAVLLAAAVLGVLRGPGVRGVRDSIRSVDASEVGVAAEGEGHGVGVKSAPVTRATARAPSLRVDGRR